MCSMTPITLSSVRKALSFALLLVLTVSLAAALPASSASAATAGPTTGAEAGRGYSVTFSYQRVSGSAFTPRDRATSWGYASVGCIYATGGNDSFTQHLKLPEGARIDYLRLYTKDTSTNDSTAWITVYDNAGQIVDLVSVDSSGSAGYGTTLSDYLGHVVDNRAHSYVLNWRPNQTGETMQLCGMRVAYRLEVQETYLPLMLRGQ